MSGVERKRRVRRVEKDPEGGWIVRDKDGRMFFDENWRWNSRSVARSVAKEIDLPSSDPRP